jgi:hypothetical protein
MCNSIDPIQYPTPVNNLDYQLDEPVSPVIVIDNKGNKYKIRDIYWFPLIDFHEGIVIKQNITHIRFLPIEVFFDKDTILIDYKIVYTNTWISKIKNVVGNNIIDKLKTRT